MASKSNEVKVGIMVIVSIIFLAAFLFAIFGVNFGKETVTYTTHLEYVGGLTEGSLVKFRGFDVGQVSEIQLPTPEDPRIGLLLELEADTPVKTDARAFVTSIGIMSEQHLEISPGSPAAGILPPGSDIPSKEVMSFAQMAETMGELSESTQVLIARVSDLLNEENRAHIASIMANANSLVSDGSAPLLKTAENLQNATAEIAEIGKNVAMLTDTSDSNLQQILTNLEKATTNAQQLTAQMGETMAGLQTLVNANHTSIREMMENFQVVSKNMEEFTRIIKEQPWLLVRKSAPPERKIK